MSQIEQNIRDYLSKHPEIEKCIQADIVNRRSLVRHLMDKKIIHKNEFEAAVATLRRYHYQKHDLEDSNLIKDLRISIKDHIIILDFSKHSELIKELKKIMDSVNYDAGETLKIVIGSSSIKIFIDQANKSKFDSIVKKYKIRNHYTNMSELSLVFPDKAINTKGIISYISREFFVNDILITELLTASPELLIYVKEEYAVDAYKLLKSLQRTIS